jgi:ribonuclease BN (tRNA processing enzyme)
VAANHTPLVVDRGMGVSRQLIIAAGVPLASIKDILISHHHSDHNLDYGNLV